MKDFYENFTINVCPNCETPKEGFCVNTIFTDSLYEMKNVSRKRLQELDKRKILPDNVKDKDYVVGRMDRGKLTDRQVDLTP